MSGIHQFTAGFSRGDAISQEALSLRAAFRGWGVESLLFSEVRRIQADLRREVCDAALAPSRCGPGDVALLHLSIGSPVNRVFQSLPCRKVIWYHNITPPHFYSRWQPSTAWALEQGVAQARALAGAADLNWAASRFNAEELTRLGFRDVACFPLICESVRQVGKPDRAACRAWRDGRTNVLFVGRVAPNKRFEDLLTAFAYFQRTVEPESRLLLAGSWAGCERYRQFLAAQVRRLALQRVEFLGPVPPALLEAAYAAADLFLCLSEHEGVGIPLLEAMARDVPVIAYAAAAVPETLDGAGLLATRKDYPVLAEWMGRLARDRGLREAVLAGQRARVARLADRDWRGDLRARLAPVWTPEGG